MKNKLWVIAIIAVIMFSIVDCEGKKSNSAGISAAPPAPSEPKAESERSFSYELTEDETGIVITGYTGTNPNLVIPRTIEGYPVKIIGNGYDNITGSSRSSDLLLRSVIIPEGVKIIKRIAFYKCVNLSKVVLPSTIESIGEFAFLDCKELYDLQIPNNITSISFGYEGYVDYMNFRQFSGCDKLPIATRKRLKDLGLRD